MTKHPRLGDVCEINPKLPRDHHLGDTSQVSFVPMAAVDEVSGTIRDRQVRRFANVRKGYTYFRDGDVLFAKITPCMENGKAAIARGLIGGVGFGSTEFHVLRAKEPVLPEWLYYFVRREPFRQAARRNFTGTGGQQRVPASFLANAEIPVPPLDEQRRIVDLLSRAEGIVRLRREAQKKAAEIIPALFVDMFGDPAANPRGWNIEAMSDVCGTCRTRDPQSDPDATFKYVDIGSIDARRGEVSNPKRLRGAEAPSRARQIVHAGDVIISTVRPNLRGSASIPASLDGQVCSTGFCVLRPSAQVRPAFVYSLVRTDWFVEELCKQVRGAQYPAVTDKNVFAMRIPVPSLELQIEFERQFEAMRSIASQQTSAEEMAEAAFGALLAQAFSK